MSRPLTLPALALALPALLAALFFASQQPEHNLSWRVMDERQMQQTQLGGDFRLFWAQAHLAAQGEAARAYEAQAIATQAPVAALGDAVTVRPSFYPPYYMLLLEPLGHLSFGWAWLVYSWGALLLLALSVVLAFPRRLEMLVLAFGFGGVWMTLSYGQNTLWLTSLYLLFTAFGARHAAVGGAALGLASFKPHLGILAPLVLLLRRQWALLVMAGLVVGALVAASWWRYGESSWLAYRDVMMAPVQRLGEFNNVSAHHLVSLYAGLRALGADMQVAVVGHGMAAVLALGCLWMICRATTDRLLPGAALVTAGLIITPHVYAYDLALLLVPLLVLVQRCQSRGWGVADICIIVPVYIVPFFITPLQHQLRAPLMPFMLLALLILLTQHALHDRTHHED